jgi:aspartyl-tRNA(Asn)/glutamyl-tRNA(Gln) amidotransferase subunit B
LECFNEGILRKTLPELPAGRITRYLTQGLKVEDAKQFTVNPVIGNFFDDVSSKIGKDSEEKIKLAANYIANDLVNSLRRDIDDQDTEIKAEISISPSNFASLMILLSEGKLSSRGGKDVLAQMILSGSDPESIAKERGLFQNSSEESLLPAIRTVIESNEKVVADYRSGKEVALMFLVGQAMKATKGSGNPEIIKKMLISELRK